MRSILLLVAMLPVPALAQEAPPAPSEPAPTEPAAPAPVSTARGEPPVELGARIYARYRAADSDPYHEFELRRARLALDLHATPWLSVQLDVDFADAAPLKDAFVEAAVHPHLSITAGQFKKPFSIIELTPPRRLPLINRGIVNERIVEAGVDVGGASGLGYGGRDRGVMLHGALHKLHYALGAFNGTRSFDAIDSGKDAAARVELRGIKGVRLGASGSMHYRNPEGFEVADPAVFAAGVDTRIRAGPVTGVAEVLWAQQRMAGGDQDVLGALGYVLAWIPLAHDIVLAPVVKGEVLDDDVSRGGDLAWSFAGGANLHFGDALRLMLQGDLIERENGSPFERKRTVVLQLAFDHKEPLARAAPVEP
ncbi:MAG: hypothetical protein HYZ27_12455 [Deltaproteobacteria bacterium]|nr:hypothetical protein [Deltaproteobacteria bacterium]